MKKLLVLGGTQMIGRDFVERVIKENQYEIYIANRGVTNPGLFDCKHIKIDRNDLETCEKLNQYTFDVVVDFSCYNANQLYNILMYLQYKEYYIISTGAVEDNSILQDPAHHLHKYATGKKDLEQYIQELKLNSEYSITIIRPCIIYGANDYTGRFYEKNGEFYRTSDNSKVEEDRDHIYIKRFTERMLLIIEEGREGMVEVYGNEIKIKEKFEYKNNFILHPNESKYITIEKFNLPFKHIVIDNVFNNATYDKMCKSFPDFIARTIPYKDQEGATSDYEAYIAGLSLHDLSENGYEFFASRYMQEFVEQQFDIKTTKFLSASAHFHVPPSKDGFIHRDYGIVSFEDQPTEFVTTGKYIYSDDTNKYPDSVKVMRSIAMMYYLNNDDNINCYGGGTGIYEGYEGGHIKTIEPKNNRLFIFEINDKSYHSYIGANFGRSTIALWMHSGPAYMINRHWKEYKRNKNLVEKWSKQKPEDYWKIEQDPEYYQYFNGSLEELREI